MRGAPNSNENRTQQQLIESRVGFYANRVARAVDYCCPVCESMLLCYDGTETDV